MAALELYAPKGPQLDSRHEVNALADPRLLEIVHMMNKAEAHLRVMVAAAKSGEVVSFGIHEGKPTRAATQWAKRRLDIFTEVCRVARESGDDAFELHLAAILDGIDRPIMPLRPRVWMAWQFCSARGRKMTQDELEQLIESQCHGSGINPAKVRPYIPTAGEVAAMTGDSDKQAALTVRDCTNHLKALGLPYAPAKAGFRKKSI